MPEEFRSDSNIAVDRTGVVFWGTANGLRRRDADAGPNALNDAVSGPIGPEELAPSRMVTDGARIFWSTSDALRMFTIASSTLVDLLPAGSTSRVNGVVLDADGTLYVTQDTAVKRCTIAADKCTFTEVAKTGSQAVDVAVDATFLYWGNLDGSVLRFRRP